MSWDRRRWTNWSGIQSVAPERHYYPDSLGEFVALVREAESATPPRRVRAVGSGWAFSAVAVTADYVVETAQLNRTLYGVLPRAFGAGGSADPNAAPAEPEGYCHVEAGVTLYELSERLDAGTGMVFDPRSGKPAGHPRWALKTSAGASGQTLGGAVSTGTHGAERHLPPLADSVRAIHLVGAGGRQHWIEAAPVTANPVAADAVLGELYPGIAVHHDEKLFRSALVAVGRFGIIYSLVLRVVPQFWLTERRSTVTWNEVAPRLQDDQSRRSIRATQIVIDPHRRPDGQHTCHVSVQRDSASDTTPPDTKRRSRSRGRQLIGRRPVRLLRGWPGDVFAATCGVLSILAGPAVGRALITGTLSLAQYPGARTGPSHAIMTRKPWAFDHVRGQSTEIFLDGSTGAYVQMLTDELLPMIDGYVAAHGYLVGWIAIRFTGPTQALLGMQRWNPTVAIEVAVLRGTAHADALLRGVQAFAIRHGGTVHWGQQIDLGPAEIEAMYPELPVWRTQLRLLALDQTGLCTFDNDACRQLGLTP